mmetsp:Transcript_74764/g.189764  ORF Transcript_74764/g.189764 Transcript_74764/m.189764 type:complete len:129 (+) Transcript_74764:75-461(+)|eukprot:CAMPEP_0183435304 /NCGR_PEP_ID=MMETSP0370-20130417/67322_1 /TAXON_ID=268820 /ORGANISM="Peridinium aciculiferum, Strain PAER-2" /LENGTH=128 /DNA_ID=CAMNT_0025622343 /DNA_START=80 /DNA_END=466 /DNA_ORIENTATION=-
MKLALFFGIGFAALAAALKQDPCAGCDESLSLAYQSCAREYGNPCAETNQAGLVASGPGTKKDVGCCLKKDKHDRCMQCKSMDCQFATCHTNKRYYSERTLVMEDKTKTKEAYESHDAKAMKAAGWGL